MNQYENLIINIIIVASVIVLSSTFFLIFISFFKFKNSKNIGIYIYALTSSMLIILGSYGFYSEAFEDLESAYNNNKYANIIIPVIAILGTFFGVFFSILVRYLIIKKSTHIHLNHHDHAHTDYIFNLRDIDNVKSKWSAILLILNHRVVEAISLGILLVQPEHTENKFQFPVDKIGFIIIFTIHIIFESIFIYYRQIEMGISKKKVLLNSIIMKVIIIPFMIIGAFIFQIIDQNHYTNWILPFMFIFSGSILVFVAIIELVPEFIDNKNMSNKQWFLVLFCFAIGMIFSLGISSLQMH